MSVPKPGSSLIFFVEHRLEILILIFFFLVSMLGLGPNSVFSSLCSGSALHYIVSSSRQYGDYVRYQMFASYTHVWDKDLIRKASSIKNVSDKDTLKYNSQKKYNLTKAGSIIKKKSKNVEFSLSFNFTVSIQTGRIRSQVSTVLFSSQPGWL